MVIIASTIGMQRLSWGTKYSIMKHNIDNKTTENTGLLITAESKTIYHKYILEGNRRSTLSMSPNDEETSMHTPFTVHNIKTNVNVVES